MTMDFRRRRPTRQALAWVQRSIGRGARVVGFRRLTGGIGSAVHRVTVEVASGERRHVVLRQYDAAERDSLVEREASALSALEQTSVPAPSLLAADATGEEAGGHPSLLMSRERGSVHLAPRDVDAWVRQMADVLALIHELDIEAPPFEPWADVANRPPPASARDDALWHRVFDVLRQPAPDTPHQFIHRDFQHFNLLWSRERLTSVIDWTWASTGPREVDVAHCRLNLAVLISAEAAETFRTAYESVTGHTVHPWWDLQGLAGFSDYWPQFIPVQVAGRRDVDVEGMAGRVEAVMAAIVRRL